MRRERKDSLTIICTAVIRNLCTMHSDDRGLCVCMCARHDTRGIVGSSVSYIKKKSF